MRGVQIAFWKHFSPNGFETNSSWVHLTLWAQRRNPGREPGVPASSMALLFPGLGSL